MSFRDFMRRILLFIFGISYLWNVHNTLASHSAGFVLDRARRFISINTAISRIPPCDITLFDIHSHVALRLVRETLFFSIALTLLLCTLAITFLRLFWLIWLFHLRWQFYMEMTVIIMRVLEVTDWKSITFLSSISCRISAVFLEATVSVNIKFILVCKRHHGWSLIRANCS